MKHGDLSIDSVVWLAASMLPREDLWFIEKDQWQTAVSKARRLIAWAAEEPKAPEPSGVHQIAKIIELSREWLTQGEDGLSLESAYQRHDVVKFLAGRWKRPDSFQKALINAGVPLELLEPYLTNGSKLRLDKLREADAAAERQHRVNAAAARRNRRARARAKEEKTPASAATSKPENGCGAKENGELTILLPLLRTVAPNAFSADAEGPFSMPSRTRKGRF